MASPLRVKISFETTTKQIEVRGAYSDLLDAVKAEFPALRNSADWQVVTVDSEGDTLLVDSDNSYKSALAVASGVPRFTVTRKGSALSAPDSAQVPTAAAAASVPTPASVPSIADLLPLLSAAGITPQAAQRMAATFLPMAAQAFTQAPGAASGGAAALGDLLRTVLGSSAGGAETASTPAPPAPVGNPAAEQTRQAPSAATPSATGTTAPAVHNGVQCDGCGMNPITGTRYKDGSRIDFDLCSTCEASSAGEAGGPWLKISTPDKAPALLICVPRGGHAPLGMGGWGRCGGGRGGRGAWRRAAYRAHQQQQQEQQQQQQEATAAEGAASTGAATTDTGAQTSTSFADQMEQAIHASLTTAAAPAATTEAAAAEGTAIEATTEATTTEATEEPATEAATEEPATVSESVATDDDSAITAAAAAGATTGDNSDSEYDILETTPLLEETSTTAATTTEAVTEENANNTTANTAAFTEQQQQQRAKRWQKEIVSLASMGFVDFALNLDLLEQHVGTPGGAGMDKVLDQLLSA